MFKVSQWLSAIKGRPNPRIGYGFAIANGIISGFAIYINSLGVKMFSDSTVYTTLKNLVVGVALLIPLALFAGSRLEYRRLSPKQWGLLLLLALVGGSVPYLLYFSGLQMTTAVTGSLLNHMQFVLVAFMATWWLQERFSPLMWLALATLLLGVVFGKNLNSLRVDEGALLVLLSTVLFAAGVVLSKYLLRQLSVLTVMAAKMSIGSLFLVGYVGVTGKLGMITKLSGEQWGFVLLTGLILLAFTVTAFIALRHASATAATAIPAASPLITTALVALTAQPNTLTPLGAIGLVLMALAIAGICAAGIRQESRTLKARQAQPEGTQA